MAFCDAPGLLKWHRNPESEFRIWSEARHLIPGSRSRSTRRQSEARSTLNRVGARGFLKVIADAKGKLVGATTVSRAAGEKRSTSSLWPLIMD